MLNELLPSLAALGETAVIVFMLHIIRSMVRDQAAERAELLQRIQAPQAAVMAHEFKSLPPSPPPLEYDNDEDFHSSREDLVAALKRENSVL